jgi:hypothetical protein
LDTDLAAVPGAICISMQCWHNGICNGNLGAVDLEEYAYI